MWSTKDYNNELEKILAKKDFSIDVKNLLLSMLYKIEAGYEDYFMVKVNIEDKNSYIEKILRIIKEDCEQIEIVTAQEAYDEEKIKKNRYLVYPYEKRIELFYPNEKNILYAIFEMNDTSIYFDEKYSLCRVALSELLNIGENINNTEVLRDFNGWSWNTQMDEIKNISINLIYQNLIFLLGFDEITKWIHQEEVINYIDVIKEKIQEIYGEYHEKRILDLICKIAIKECIKTNIMERERLYEEKEDFETQLERLNQKEELIEEAYKTKKSVLSKINVIDKKLNNEELLEKEFIKRNKDVKPYFKIFSLAHLTEILNKERKKLLTTLEENNQLLDPRYYVELKKGIEEQYKLLEDMELGEMDDKFKMIQLQKIILKCFTLRVEKAKEKMEVLELMYMYRYYRYLPMDENTLVRDYKELEGEFLEVESKLIEKAIASKIILKVSEEEEFNQKVLKNIFNTRMINLEKMNMRLKKENNEILIEVFDDKFPDNTVVQAEEIQKEKLKVKFNKIFKVFA